MHFIRHRGLRKYHFAFLFAALALLSWSIDISRTNHASLSRDISSVPLALAKDDRTAGPLEMFLKVDGVPGDSLDQKHKGEIEIDSYAWQLARGMGTQKPSMQSFTITMPTGKATSRLFLNAAGGVRLQRVVLSVRKAGTDLDFLKWTLTDSAVTAFKTVGNTHGDGVTDQVEITFGKIEIQYSPLDGSEVQKSGWDQRTGKSVGY